MDGWQGENCVLLSSVRFDDLPSDANEVASAPRQHWVAIATGRKWHIAPGGREACPQP